MRETIFKNKNYKPLSPLGGVNITAVSMESYVERPHQILFPLTLFGKATTYKLHELTTQRVSLI